MRMKEIEQELKAYESKETSERLSVAASQPERATPLVEKEKA